MIEGVSQFIYRAIEDLQGVPPRNGRYESTL